MLIVFWLTSHAMPSYIDCKTQVTTTVLESNTQALFIYLRWRRKPATRRMLSSEDATWFWRTVLLVSVVWIVLFW